MANRLVWGSGSVSLSVLSLSFLFLRIEGLRIAILITGAKRALCTHEYLSNFKANLLDKFTSKNWEFNVFVETSVHGADTSYRSGWGAESRIDKDGEFGGNCSNLGTFLKPVIFKFRSNWDKLVPPKNCLTLGQHAQEWYAQFKHVYQIYKQVEDYERFTGLSFNYILKTRTDIYLFDPLPDTFFSSTHAVIPLGGMTCNRDAECCNDHLFVCPRHLCSPYFNVSREYEDCADPSSLAKMRQDIPQTHFLLHYTPSTLVTEELLYTLIRRCDCGFTLACKRVSMCDEYPHLLAVATRCQEEASSWIHPCSEQCSKHSMGDAVMPGF